MGGCGSGRHHGVRKRRVESCLALDVNELRRKGVLTLGASGTLAWKRGGAEVASMNFRADSGDLVLSYDNHNAEALRALEQCVALSSVPAAFGSANLFLMSWCGMQPARLSALFPQGHIPLSALSRSRL
jgi:hypothetical protein